MRETGAYPCPHCGYTGRSQPDYALRQGTILNGKYLIGCVLGQGGFGITYVGWDLSLEIKVAVKEYYPSGAVSRSLTTGSTVKWYDNQKAATLRNDGVASSVREARKMAKVAGVSGVVHVREVFAENNTAYIVMDFAEGRTLKSLVDKNGTLSWDQARRIFLPAIETLAKVHDLGIIHRDISPDNIMVGHDGSVQILDLGAAKDLAANSGASSMLVAKNGFSPVEQYGARGNTGPWTDVYAMAATIYYTLTGIYLPMATDRLDQDMVNWDLPQLQSLPANVRRALRKAMSVQKANRQQSARELLNDLKEEKGRSPLPWIGLAAACLVVACVAVVFLITGGKTQTHTHIWSDATCEQAKKCTICGKTSGEPLGHYWLDPTHSSPKTCLRCGATEGSPLPTEETTAPKAMVRMPSVGDYVTMGTYPQTKYGNDNTPIEWLVLDKDGTSVLLLSRYGLDTDIPYNNRYVSVTWQSSSVRTWLNGRFLSSFTANEQNAILTTWVDNGTSQGFRHEQWTGIGGYDTQDKVFLLSYAEASRYLGITGPGTTGPVGARVIPTAYAENKDAYISEKHEASNGAMASWWWLRSPGINQYDAACVRSGGCLGEEMCTESIGCIRPAMWVDWETLHQ